MRAIFRGGPQKLEKVCMRVAPTRQRDKASVPASPIQFLHSHWLPEHCKAARVLLFV